jgi:hypothetical protein
MQSGRLTEQDILLLASVIARVPSASLLPSLNWLLEEFLDPISFEPDASLVKQYWYDVAVGIRDPIESPFIRAYLSIDDDTTIEAMKLVLPIKRFALNAVCFLLRKHDSNFSFLPSLDTIGSSRGELSPLQTPGGPANLNSTFDKLNLVILDFLSEGSVSLAMLIGQAALSIPDLLPIETIRRLLGFDDFPNERSLLLKRLALNGAQIRADDVDKTTRALLGEESSYYFTGRKAKAEENACLLLFSDDPARLGKYFSGSASVPSLFWKLIPRAPAKSAEDALFSLADEGALAAGSEEWLSSVLSLGTDTSAHRLIGMCCSEQYSTFIAGWARHGSYFKQLFERYPECRVELAGCDVWMRQGRAADDLLGIVASTGDGDSLRSILRGYAGVERKFDDLLSATIGALVFSSPGILYGPYREPKPDVRDRIQTIRSQLFGTARGESKISSLARRALTELDDYLDMSRSNVREVRHPNLSAHLPWPALTPP